MELINKKKFAEVLTEVKKVFIKYELDDTDIELVINQLVKSLDITSTLEKQEVIFKLRKSLQDESG
jgi:uncharacterized protein YpuA (DUF1002 family)